MEKRRKKLEEFNRLFQVGMASKIGEREGEQSETQILENWDALKRKER